MLKALTRKFRGGIMNSDKVHKKSSKYSGTYIAIGENIKNEL